jgi:hypothetical protein
MARGGEVPHAATGEDVLAHHNVQFNKGLSGREVREGTSHDNEGIMILCGIEYMVDDNVIYDPNKIIITRLQPRSSSSARSTGRMSWIPRRGSHCSH